MGPYQSCCVFVDKGPDVHVRRAGAGSCTHGALLLHRRGCRVIGVAADAAAVVAAWGRAAGAKQTAEVCDGATTQPPARQGHRQPHHGGGDGGDGKVAQRTVPNPC